MLFVPFDFADTVLSDQLHQLRAPIRLREKRRAAMACDVGHTSCVKLEGDVHAQAVRHARADGIQRRAEILGRDEPPRLRRQHRPVQQRGGREFRRHESSHGARAEHHRVRLGVTLHVDDPRGVQGTQLRPGHERFTVRRRCSVGSRRTWSAGVERTHAVAVVHPPGDRVRNRGEAVPLQQWRRHRPQACPRIVEAQRHVPAIEFQAAGDVREDVVGRRRAIAVLRKVAQLGLEILPRDVMKVKDRKKAVLQRATEHELRKPAGGKIEAAAQHAAALIEGDSGFVHRKTG